MSVKHRVRVQFPSRETVSTLRLKADKVQERLIMAQNKC